MKANRIIPACTVLLLLCTTIAFTTGDTRKTAPSNRSAAIDSGISGPDLYRGYCASCHGTTARGNGPAAKALKSPPPDLTALARKNGGRYPGGHVYQIIEWGGAIASHGSREMPVWGVAFRPVSGENQKQVAQRIRALTDYLESIQLK